MARTKLTKQGRIMLARKVGIDQDYQHKIIVDESPRILINKSCSIGVSFCVAFKKLLDAIEEPDSYKLFVSQRRENVNLIIEYVFKFHTLDITNHCSKCHAFAIAVFNVQETKNTIFNIIFIQHPVSS